MVKKEALKLTVKEIRQRVEDNDLDLSLSQIENIPVKEIATISKVKSLDLSCNLIVRVPMDFAELLCHLTKLDLSKNKIVELPKNIGLLQQLQHLDLYQNNISVIPIGFSRLDKLKWLDFKDNPLHSNFAKVVGDCLDDKQCRQCAKRVVSTMKTIVKQQETMKKRKLEEQKRKEALKKQEEKKLAEEKLLQKKKEKEQKKKERAAALREKINQNANNTSEQHKDKKVPSIQKNQKTSRRTCGIGKCLFSFIVLVAAVYVGAYYYCESNKEISQCQLFNEYATLVNSHLSTSLQKGNVVLSKVIQQAQELLLVGKVQLSKAVDRVQVMYKDWING